MQSTWAVMVSSCTISPINKFVRQQKYSENVAKDNLGILCWPFCTHTAEQCKANIYFLWWIKSGLFTAILLFSRSSIFYLYSVMNVTDGHLNGAGWLGEASGRWLGGIILIMSDKLSGASLRIISRHDHGPPAPAARTRTWVNQRRFCSHVVTALPVTDLCQLFLIFPIVAQIRRNSSVPCTNVPRCG